MCASFLPSWIRIRIQGPHWIRIRIQNTGKKEINLKKEANLWKRYYFEESWLPPVVGPVISSNVMNIISGGLNKARWRKQTKPPEYGSFSNAVELFLFVVFIKLSTGHFLLEAVGTLYLFGIHFFLKFRDITLLDKSQTANRRHITT